MLNLEKFATVTNSNEGEDLDWTIEGEDLDWTIECDEEAYQEALDNVAAFLASEDYKESES